MPARTGRQYLAGLREQEREVWLEGERVKDPTRHPGLRGGARAIASLYDMQCDPKLRDEMTYVSPTTGDRVGLSFIIPRTREDLEKRRAMMLNWARTTCGMMGRSPDFMNVTYAAWAGAADYFAGGEHGRPEFAENMRRYYEYIRENDLTLTHSLINLQRSRTVSGIFNLAGRDGTGGHPRDRCRHCRARRADPRDIGAARRRDRRLLAAHGAARRNPQPVRGQLCDPVRHAGPQIPVPREFRSGPVAFRPPARLALRGDGLRRLLRRRAGAVGARLSAGRRGPPQPHRQCHAFLGAFGPSRGGQEPRQGRVRARRGIADDPDTRQFAIAECRGAHRRIDALHPADPSLHARRRGRRASSTNGGSCAPTS